MKRICAFTMALAIVLTLVACGNNANQPSSNTTPPVTQDGPNQPPSTPAENPQPAAQPSEPADVAPEEPQEPEDSIPEGAFMLYDGEHYLVKGDGTGDLAPYVLLGEKINKSSTEFEMTQYDAASGEIWSTSKVVFGSSTAPLTETLTIEGPDGQTLQDILSTMTRNISTIVQPGEVKGWPVGGSIASAQPYVGNITDTEKNLKIVP